MIKKRPVRVITKRRKKPFVYAFGQHICMSAHKARRVIDQIRGRSYEETLMILELMPYRTCYPIFQLVYSAAANASHNMGFNKANLVISEAKVNEGATVKRLKPRARGRNSLIKRPTCHIALVLIDRVNFYKQCLKYLYPYLFLDKEEEYEESTLCLKKSLKEIRGDKEKKTTGITSHHMYSSEGLWDKK